VGQLSVNGPSLASFNGNLYIAWTGEHVGNLYVACAPNGGMVFDGPGPSTQKSNESPSLAVNGTNLMIAWAGTSNNVCVAQVSLSDAAPAIPANVDPLPNTVALNVQCPSLASVTGILYLAWADGNTSQLAMLSSVDNGQTSTNFYQSWQRAPVTPTGSTQPGPPCALPVRTSTSPGQVPTPHSTLLNLSYPQPRAGRVAIWRRRTAFRGQGREQLRPSARSISDEESRPKPGLPPTG
jgi:hypothetical protein